MEDEIKTKPLNEETQDNDVFSLNVLVNLILDYYCEVSADEEPAEKWKKGTELEAKKIPEDIDELVKKAFKAQLKKFTK